MSKCEWFAQVPQDKWATVNKSLRSLITNEQMWAICSGSSGQMSESLTFWANHSLAHFFEQIPHFSLLRTKNDWFAKKNLKKFIFFLRFYSFLKFFKKQKIRSFLLRKVSESLRSLRTNEWQWASRSEGMSDRERITQVAHQKLAKEWIIHVLRESLICSLFWQKICDLLRNSMKEVLSLQDTTNW